VSELDRSIFFLINNGLNSPVNDLWLGYATWLGNGWVAFPLAVIILFYLDRRHLGRNVLVLASAGILGGVLNSVIKALIHAPRPLEVFRPAIEAGQLHVHVMFDSLYANSFPSGHAQTISSVVTVLIWAFARRPSQSSIRLAATLSIFIVLIVGMSRIYVGAHFPSDVLGGMLIGSLSSALVCRLYDFRFSSRKNPDEKIGIPIEPEIVEIGVS
jgi:undecaprenyl-diphosphatase